MSIAKRRSLASEDLWPQERELCTRSVAGDLLDLRSRRLGGDDPRQGRKWGPERNIRAEVLFQLLTGHGPELAFPVIAVRVRGARIVGRLNLGGMQLQCPLELYDCHLYRLGLAKAKTPNISLRGSYLQSGLSGRYLRVEHTLNLSGRFRCDGRVVLRNANIGGDLACSGATISNPQGDALFAHGLAVDANAFLLETKVIGRVFWPTPIFGGQLNCSRATFSNEQGQALYANRLIVDGDMILSKAEVTGSVWLAAARIGQQLNCTGATFSNDRGDALQADNLVVKKDIALNAAKITGEVRLLHAHIGGDLACRGATFSNRRWKALSADGLIADRNVYLDKAKVAGEVRLPDAQFSG